MSIFDPPEPPDPIVVRRYTYRVQVELFVEVDAPMDKSDPIWEDAAIETAYIVVESAGNRSVTCHLQLDGRDDDADLIRVLGEYVPDPPKGEEL